jgi:hypothetical protein
MKTTRTFNKKLFKECVRIRGVAIVAVEAECSPSMIEKLCSESYKGMPSMRKIDGLCRATGQTIECLFPVVEDKKEAS